MMRNLITLVTVWAAATLHQQALAQPDLQSRGAYIGINGATCAFSSIGAAIQAASSGDTIYVAPSFTPGFIGKIDKSLTFVPSEAAGPGFSGCEQEMATAESDTVIFDAKSFSDDATGGLAEIRNGADVTFRHMWLRTASATDGGVLAVTGGSSLTLNDVRVTGGVASNRGGLIFVEGSVGNPSSLILNEGTELYSGNASTGGGIALNNATLEINNASVGVSNADFNTATGNGGGIHAVSTDIGMTNQTRIQYNVSGNNGGGLYADDSFINTSVIDIENNQAEFSGGGFFLHDTLLFCNRCDFVSNINNNQQPNSGGGALYAEENSLVTLIRNEFNFNTGHLGGAIHVRTGPTLDISNESTFTGNFATNGGAIHAENAITLDDVSFIDNLAADNGGGIHCLSCGDLDINQSQITNNSADVGGGLYISGPANEVDITSTTLNLNTAPSTQQDQGEGGGLYMSDGTLTLMNSIIDQNSSALFGGGLYLGGSSGNGQVVSIVNTAFTANTTTNSAVNQQGGAGLYSSSSDVQLTDALFQLNYTDGIGGGALFQNVDNVDISGTVFDQNTAEGFGGGGLYAGASTVTIRDQSQFTNNDGDAFGGGFRVFGGSAVVRDALIDNNVARFGGGIHSQLASQEIINSRIVNNSGIVGGGLYVNGGEITVRAATGSSPGACDPTQLATDEYCMEISGNSVTDTGGGVSLRSTGGSSFTATFDQVAILNNQADTRGSAMFMESNSTSTAQLSNLLVAGNGNLTDETTVIGTEGEVNLLIDSSTLAGNFGSPLWITDIMSTMTLTNSILYENSIGPNVATGVPFTRNCNNAQTITTGSQSMNGNLGDPSFITTTRGDYRLPGNSVSVNQCVDGPTRDLDGLFRPDVSGLYDQGAFEFEGLLMLPDELFENGFED